MAGEPTLWFDKWIYLDKTSGGYQWWLSANNYLHFGNASGVLYTLEYTAVGAGAASVELAFTRSSASTAEESNFEDMNVAAIALTRTRATVIRGFGADGTAGDKYPRGLGSVRLENTDITNWAAVRLRIWYALQD